MIWTQKNLLKRLKIEKTNAKTEWLYESDEIILFLKKIIAFGEIHESLPKGVDHKGVVKNPSYLYMPGDIYLSFSSLEGLQRSVMEALIRGCFVICLKRPDSLFLSQSPLVYVVNNLLEVENTLLKIDSISLESYQKMYEENYKFLSSKFSKKVIQEKWLSLT